MIGDEAGNPDGGLHFVKELTASAATRTFCF
jgi:hypothetical protein